PGSSPCAASPGTCSAGRRRRPAASPAPSGGRGAGPEVGIVSPPARRLELAVLGRCRLVEPDQRAEGARLLLGCAAGLEHRLDGLIALSEAWFTRRRPERHVLPIPAIVPILPAALSVSGRHIRRLCVKGKLRHKRVGKLYRIHADELAVSAAAPAPSRSNTE